MSNKKMAYARVSSTDQNLDRQLIELKNMFPKAILLLTKSAAKRFTDRVMKP